MPICQITSDRSLIGMYRHLEVDIKFNLPFKYKFKRVICIKLQVVAVKKYVARVQREFTRLTLVPEEQRLLSEARRPAPCKSNLDDGAQSPLGNNQKSAHQSVWERLFRFST